MRFALAYRMLSHSNCCFRTLRGYIIAHRCPKTSSSVPFELATFSTSNITVLKVGILNFCYGIRWTVVLKSVQRNPPTNAVTLLSIPLFCRILCSEFHCMHWSPLSNTLNIRILQWIRKSTLHRYKILPNEIEVSVLLVSQGFHRIRS